MDAIQKSLEGLDVPIIDWSLRAKSVSLDEREIMRWIVRIWNRGEPFECDPCYSTGHTHIGIGAPRFKFDNKPQTEDTREADCRHLPLDDDSIQSLFYDPPYNARNAKTSVFSGAANPYRRFRRMARFGSYGSVKELWAFYRNSLREFWRILKPGGLLVVKIQNCIASGKRIWSADYIKRVARGIGFDLEDEFVFPNLRPAMHPGMAKQQHARSAHCYFFVFIKPQAKRKSY